LFSTQASTTFVLYLAKGPAAESTTFVCFTKF